MGASLHTPGVTGYANVVPGGPRHFATRTDGDMRTRQFADDGALFRTATTYLILHAVFLAVLLIDGSQAVAAGQNPFPPRIFKLIPACAARGATLEINVSGFNTTATTVTIGGVPTTIVRRVTEGNSLKKLVVTVPQTAPPGRTTVAPPVPDLAVSLERYAV